MLTMRQQVQTKQHHAAPFPHATQSLDPKPPFGDVPAGLIPELLFLLSARSRQGNHNRVPRYFSQHKIQRHAMSFHAPPHDNTPRHAMPCSSNKTSIPQHATTVTEVRGRARLQLRLHIPSPTPRSRPTQSPPASQSPNPTPTWSPIPSVGPTLSTTQSPHPTQTPSPTPYPWPSSTRSSASEFDPKSMAESVPESKSEYVTEIDPNIDFDLDFDSDAESDS